MVSMTDTHIWAEYVKTLSTLYSWPLDCRRKEGDKVKRKTDKERSINIFKHNEKGRQTDI
jgi:hypothetical protein